MEKLRILMLEDSANDAELAERTLRKGGIKFECLRVDTRDEFIKAITNYSPTLIISDHALPQFNSIEALRIIKQLEFKGPFILLTGAVSDEFAVNCLKMGADDYVLKTNLVRLPTAVRSAVKQHKAKRRRQEVEWALRKRNEELIKINNELDSFVYSVSHNLRAPLMSVLGLINLADKEDKDREGHLGKYFHLMQYSITKLDETLHEILDYSRNARGDLKIQAVDIHQVIHDSLEKLKFLDGFERIKHSLKIENEKSLYTDAYRLSLIFANIFSNAIKYMDKRKELCVLHVHVVINKEACVITIEDNGIGIAPELQGNIFDMFFRATAESDGAGLGLYIVKEAVRKLQGQITFESTLGKGTRFIIDIPNLTVQHLYS